jgi:hypothetical protein
MEKQLTVDGNNEIVLNLLTLEGERARLMDFLYGLHAKPENCIFCCEDDQSIHHLFFQSVVARQKKKDMRA